MKKIIFILGPQGSGKGTQAKLLATTLGIPALSMGDLIRAQVAAGGDLGEQLNSIIQKGELVPDVLALEILQKRVSEPDAEDGFILDGYPRNKAQYEAYSRIGQPTHVVLIDVPREVSLERLSSRAQIEGRTDDTPDVINRRLEIYETDTKAVLDAYRDAGILYEVDGVGLVEDVQKKLIQAVR